MRLQDLCNSHVPLLACIGALLCIVSLQQLTLEQYVAKNHGNAATAILRHSMQHSVAALRDKPVKQAHGSQFAVPIGKFVDKDWQRSDAARQNLDVPWRLDDGWAARQQYLVGGAQAYEVKIDMAAYAESVLGVKIDVLEDIQPYHVSRYRAETSALKRKQEAVRRAMQHAWASYVKYAWGYDELRPIARSGTNVFGGIGITILDSLDTLFIMDLHSEFAAALDYLRYSFDLETSTSGASVFEVIIRGVGGMMAAHDLSGDDMLVLHAVRLLEQLWPAFRAPDAVFPYNGIVLGTKTVLQRQTTLADVGSCLLEFDAASRKSGLQKYVHAAHDIMADIARVAADSELKPVYLDSVAGVATDTFVTVGSKGDSYYEYLLKYWLLSSKQDDWYRSKWELAMDAMLSTLLHEVEFDIQRSAHANSTRLAGLQPVQKLAYISGRKGSDAEPHFEHLTCFIPGMLALGVHTGAVVGEKADAYLHAAERVAETCYIMYANMATGLSPEWVDFVDQDVAAGPREGARNILRPEAVESWFVLWRVTHAQKYRDWAWSVFQSFEKHCRTPTGYTGLKSVNVLDAEVQYHRDDLQQSFFMAETLKYLYLIFAPDELLDLNEWVFTTEAHPLRIRAARSHAVQHVAHAETERKGKKAHALHSSAPSPAVAVQQ